MIGFGQNLAIGDTYQGGIIFYLDGNGGGLIVAPEDQAIISKWAESCYAETISSNKTAIGSGSRNTIELEKICTQSETAADICANLSLGGYSDWFLPSKDELNIMYINLTQKQFNLGNFRSHYYWSSSLYGSKLVNFVWVQNFGAKSDFWKDNSDNQNFSFINSFAGGSAFYVRAIRAF